MIQSRTMLILACLLFLVATRGPASGQPPRRYLADTVPDGSGGFLYHFYDVFDTPLDWASAHAFAQTLLDPVAGHTVGTVSHLVAIDSQKENDFVQGIINGDSWIGLTDRVGVSQNSPLGTVVVPATEGNWNWTLTHPINAPWLPTPAPIAAHPLSPNPGGLPTLGNNWASGQPGSPSADAAFMQKSTGKWNSAPSGYGLNLPVTDPTNLDENFNFRLPYVVEYELYEFNVDDYLNNGGT